jgi:hypothetical protein
MASAPLVRQAEQAVRDGLAYVLSGQHRDGFWRDYELKPGASEGWVTSWIGWSLARFGRRGPVRDGLVRAGQAIIGSGAAQGWGYNRASGVDADSSAWALRFLAACGYRCGHLAPQILGPFISPCGAVRTFSDARTGTWSDPHADVAAIVGLALLESNAPRGLADLVATRLAMTQRRDGGWPSFWWGSDVYATAWAGAFLASAGRAPRQGVEWMKAHLCNPSCQRTPLEQSLAIMLLSATDADSPVLTDTVADLLDGQMPTKRWPASPLLLVPPRGHGAAVSPVGPHADNNGFVTTAMACVALGRWADSVRAGRAVAS